MMTLEAAREAEALARDAVAACEKRLDMTLESLAQTALEIHAEHQAAEQFSRPAQRRLSDLLTVRLRREAEAHDAAWEELERAQEAENAAIRAAECAEDAAWGAEEAS